MRLIRSEFCDFLLSCLYMNMTWTMFFQRDIIAAKFVWRLSNASFVLVTIRMFMCFVVVNNELNEKGKGP